MGQVDKSLWWTQCHTGNYFSRPGFYLRFDMFNFIDLEWVTFLGTWRFLVRKAWCCNHEVREDQRRDGQSKAVLTRTEGHGLVLHLLAGWSRLSQLYVSEPPYAHTKWRDVTYLQGLLKERAVLGELEGLSQNVRYSHSGLLGAMALTP